MAEYNKEKITECIFNPDISIILAELENGEKKLTYLTEKTGISADEIKNRLAYLIEVQFVIISDSVVSVDSDKLAKFMENDENYKGVVDGLTELDSYLN